MFYKLALPSDLSETERKVVKKYEQRPWAFGFGVLLIMLLWAVVAVLFIRHVPALVIGMAIVATTVAAVVIVERVLIAPGKALEELAANKRALLLNNGFAIVFVCLVRPLVRQMTHTQYERYCELQFPLLLALREHEVALDSMQGNLKTPAERDAYNTQLGELLTLLGRGQEQVWNIIRTTP